VTECPYCGTRLRKRAPKLERHGDELTPQEDRHQRRLRRKMERRERRESAAEALAGRPYATISAIGIPSALLLLQKANVLSGLDLGAIVGTTGVEWWRYLAAPWIYADVGYLFVCALAIAIFGLAVERRLGSVSTALLMIACGALGMLAAVGIESALDNSSGIDIVLISGGNGVGLGLVAAWAVLKAGELRADPDQDAELIGAAVAVIVLVLLSLVLVPADIFAGLAGGLVGAGAGFAASVARGQRRSG
jgi:membrane associated rhomboid family serine protease